MITFTTDVLRSVFLSPFRRDEAYLVLKSGAKVLFLFHPTLRCIGGLHVKFENHGITLQVKMLSLGLITRLV